MNDSNKNFILGMLVAGVAVGSVGGIFYVSSRRETANAGRPLVLQSTNKSPAPVGKPGSTPDRPPAPDRQPALTTAPAPFRDPASVTSNTAEAWAPLLDRTNDFFSISKTLQELNKRGQTPKELVPRLIELGRDPRTSHQLAVISILGKMKQQTNEAKVFFIECLQSGDQMARALAVQNLGGMGARASDAVLPIIEMIKTERFMPAKQMALTALGKIASQPDVAVPFLIERLRDPKEEFKGGFIQAIGGFGSDAREAVPVLNELGAEEKYRSVVELALKQIN